LAVIVGYVTYRGASVISIRFLTTAPSAIRGTFGIAGNIINTLYMILITLLIAVPFGIGAAIYLNEYAKPGRLVKLIEFTTETLSGIPSIIFGLFGYVFFGLTLQLGYSILTGALTLSLMVLPLITRNTQEALKTVPAGYRSGAMGIGATKWYMIRTILLPSAMPGIITGVILSVGRIVGESAALLFTAGSGYLLPRMGQFGEGLIEKIMQPGGTLTIQLYLSMEKARYEDAFGIALVLLIIVFLINMLTKYLTKRFHVDK
jgi:phosphate transport system permease protein